MKIKIFTLLLLTSLFANTNHSFSQMVVNHSAYFGGAGSSFPSFMTVAHSASLNITGSFSLNVWVKPNDGAAAQIILQKRLNANNNGYTLYLSNNKPVIRTNQTTRLIGKTAIPDDAWTHVAGTYNSSTGNFRIYINGVLDTSTTIAAAAPLANTDSLLIAKGINSPYGGELDDIQIWNKELSGSLIAEFFRQSLGTNTGYYSGLVLSMGFQDPDNAVSSFTTADQSGNDNNGHAINVGEISYEYEPSTTTYLNECLTLDGTGDYLSGPDHANVSPTSAITLEAWVNPRSFNANTNVYSTIIHKGNPSGGVTDYRVEIQNRKFRFVINETDIFNLTTSGEFFPLNQWTHFAVTYSGTTGFISFFLNGQIRWDDTNFVGNVHDNLDSVYIGGTALQTCFDGYIDEAKIASSTKNFNDITNNCFTSVNQLNDPSGANVAYNFDGLAVSNSNSGPRLNFRNNAKFSFSPTSPLAFSEALQLSKGFFLSENLSSESLRIPATGTNGFMNSDTIDVELSEAITDVNVFVGLNHTDEDNLIISLISPSGITVPIYNTSALVAGDDIATVFDDQAALPMATNTYTGFTPEIRPYNNMLLFNGTNTKGKWKLRIQDAAAGDTGRLYQWGIQFNNVNIKKSVLSLTSLIQGFYNPSTNLMIADTMRAIIRSSIPPHNVGQEQKAFLDASGKANFTFTNLIGGVPLYFQLKHRNSIETWTRNPVSGTFKILNNFYVSPFDGRIEFDFTTSSSKAFGSNQVLVDTGPSKFAIYGGDVNQDGVVDATDAGAIDNDAFNFVTGYIQTDLTGDNVCDASDAAIADNNASNFVSRITP